MTESQLRALIVPAIVLIAAFGVIRGCAKHMARNRAEQPAAETVAAAPTPTPRPVSAAPAKTSDYPEGLDEARIQYLVEADATFSTPAVAKFPKKYADYDSVTIALARSKFVEKDIDGTVKVTRDGSLHMDGLRDAGDHYEFVTAKRVFDKVVSVKRIADDKVQVTITWHWDSNEAGKSVMRSSGTSYTGSIAEFTGSGGQWALSGWPLGLRS